MNTCLHLADTAVTLTLPDGSRHEIALNPAELARRELRQMPPTDYQWETAIMTVEDAIAPMRALLPPQSTLYLHADSLRPLAVSDGLITQNTIEQAFQRISRYGSDPALPPNLHTYAELLIVREWLHHMHFESAQLR